MTPGQPSGCEGDAPYGAMLLHCGERVTRAGWVVSANLTVERGNDPTIELEDCDQEIPWRQENKCQKIFQDGHLSIAGLIRFGKTLAPQLLNDHRDVICKFRLESCKIGVASGGKGPNDHRYPWL